MEASNNHSLLEDTLLLAEVQVKVISYRSDSLEFLYLLTLKIDAFQCWLADDASCSGNTRGVLK